MAHQLYILDAKSEIFITYIKKFPTRQNHLFPHQSCFCILSSTSALRLISRVLRFCPKKKTCVCVCALHDHETVL